MITHNLSNISNSNIDLGEKLIFNLQDFTSSKRLEVRLLKRDGSITDDHRTHPSMNRDTFGDAHSLVLTVSCFRNILENLPYLGVVRFNIDISKAQNVS